LHSENITHKNIKPENIFVVDNSPLEVKIGAYDLASFDKDLSVRFKKIYINYRIK